ncbi:type II toxin-antitoxin system RelE family toxin [Nitrososphaera viennensis]|uniref:Type II toxin-antitoxin system RelE/ParE family toxin n=2 Tax=Nitrososphaera viennensis TaxID=1034015 RepID=A0A977IBJ1_9ARCH|nr:type II toxin-antitoxin system RelE/ParE family toxin [Nitrososphaera viennensis]AIC15935.1 putative RelE protein [Nitrososphaera viennensis EN76]UVS67918.1 type II toxin-antitoxin system RelE/ParE family toxin [Nitrososphaera viennensis]
MTFEIRWTETTFKKLQKLDRVAQERIIERLDEAAADPFAMAKKLSGVNLYSIRVGDYRAIVSIEKGKMLVLVVDLGHRSKIYKKL